MRVVVLIFAFFFLGLSGAQGVSSPEAPKKSTEENSLPKSSEFTVPDMSPSVKTVSAEDPSLELITFKGVLLERGTSRPLSGVNIFFLPSGTKVVTEESGYFEAQYPADSTKMIVNLTGYIRRSMELKMGQRPVKTQIYLQRKNYDQFETTIVGKQKKRDQVVKVLTQADFLSAPGARQDPVIAIENLPGVARTDRAEVVIQGSSEEDTVYAVDGHSIPQIFHFGGLSSVVFPEAVESVDYLSAGYGPEFGNSISGVVSLKTRSPKKDRWHYITSVDLLNSSVLAEGPVAEDKSSSFLIGARYGYFGLVLKAAQEARDDTDSSDSSDNGASANLTEAPTYWDITSIYQKKISDDSSFKLVAITSSDFLRLTIDELPDSLFSGEFRRDTSFYRFIPSYEKRWNATTDFRTSIAFGSDDIEVSIGDVFFDLNSQTYTARAEAEKKWSDKMTSILGLDFNYTQFTIGTKLPSTIFGDDDGIGTPAGISEVVNLQVDSEAARYGFFLRNQYSVGEGSWKVFPNLRYDIFNLTGQQILQPRLSSSYEINRMNTINFAVGLYHQTPQFIDIQKETGNESLSTQKAIHYYLGFDRDFRNGDSTGLLVKTGLFYKDLSDLVISSSNSIIVNGVEQPERYNNQGKGRIYGAELQAKYFKRPYQVQFSYTYLQSLRKKPGEPEYPSEFEQVHNLNLIGSYKGENWNYSTRVRYVTGAPETPVTSAIYSGDDDVYFPVRGQRYSERFPAFFQLDFRVDRKWIYDTWILSLYVDIQNVTNQTNPSQRTYSFDYTEKIDTSSIPLFPSVGVKGEF